MIHIVEKIQEAVNVVEKWSYSKGFKFLVEKTKQYCSLEKRGVAAQIKICGQRMECL